MNGEKVSETMAAGVPLLKKIAQHQKLMLEGIEALRGSQRYHQAQEKGPLPVLIMATAIKKINKINQLPEWLTPHHLSILLPGETPMTNARIIQLLASLKNCASSKSKCSTMLKKENLAATNQRVEQQIDPLQEVRAARIIIPASGKQSLKKSQECPRHLRGESISLWMLSIIPAPNSNPNTKDQATPPPQGKL